MQILTMANEKINWRDITLVIGCSIILGTLGKLMIPLPFTPVPIALRSQIVLLMAVFLGPKRAALAVLGFLAQGFVGLPVFAHGVSGLGALVGPNGGYLVGYLAAAVVTGYLAKRHLSFSLFAGTAVIYLFGAGYLATFMGFSNAILLGVVPFLVGDAVKIALNWKIVRSVREYAEAS